MISFAATAMRPAAPLSGSGDTGDETWMPRAFAFGPFVLQPERQLLTKAGHPVRIGGRALDILTALIERPGELLSKQELIDRVWPKIFVDEGNLKANVAALRRALDERHLTPLYIATVVGRGYRFIGLVRSHRAPAGGDQRSR